MLSIDSDRNSTALETNITDKKENYRNRTR
jgi:hypothetical protein